jgi:hypothetical protein
MRFETNVGSLREREDGVDKEREAQGDEEGKCWLGAMIGEEFQGEAQGEGREKAR